MKRASIILSVAFAAIVLASCQKVEEPAMAVDGQKTTLTINADILSTRTSVNIETLKVNWTEGDVIYACTSDTTWGRPYKEDKDGTSIADFVYSDGSFTTTKEIAAGTYEFWLGYKPGSRSYQRTGDHTFKLYSTQEQDCSDPLAHIANYDLLAGKFSATVTTNPDYNRYNVHMKHLFALMEVDVVNNTGKEITVSKFSMDVDEATKISGIFDVDFTDDDFPLSLSSSNKPYVNLNVTGGTVANGGTLKLYFMMAPMTNYTGDVKFCVTDSANKTYTLTKSMTRLSFAAGSYNVASYPISTTDDNMTTYDFTFNEKMFDGLGSKKLGTLDWTLDTDDANPYLGFDKGTYEKGLQIGKASQSVSSASLTTTGFGNPVSNVVVTTAGASSIQATVSVSVGGVSYTYDGATETPIEVNKINFTFSAPGAPQSGEVVISWAQTSSKAIYVKRIQINAENPPQPTCLSPTISCKSNVVTITTPTAGASIYYTIDGTEPSTSSTLYNAPFTLTESVTVKAIAAKDGHNNSAVSSTNCTYSEVTPVIGTLVVANSVNDWSGTNNAHNKTLTIENLGTWTVTTTCDGVVFTDAYYSTTDDTMYYTISRNPGSSRDGWIKVTLSKEGKSDITKTFNWTQSANPDADPATEYEIQFGSAYNSKKISSYTDTMVVTYNGFACEVINFNNNNNSWNFVKCGRKNTASVAQITTVSPIAEAIKTVKLTIDAVTASKVNSIKLYVSTSANFTGAQEITIDSVAEGTRKFTVTTPTANCYYKLVFDCASNSSNGIVQISKVLFTTD